MYKVYDGFISLFSEENMSKIWDFCKTSAMSMFENFMNGSAKDSLISDLFWKVFFILPSTRWAMDYK